MSISEPESSLDSSDRDSFTTEYATDNEIEPQTDPIAITPDVKPNKRKMKILKASSLPLVAVLNARSLYNKPDNLKTFMNELGVELLIASETWEREELSVDTLLNMPNFNIHTYRRPKTKSRRQPGGSCAIICNERRFKFKILSIQVPTGVEACWVLLKPIDKSDLIENIAVASIYVSPNSVYKTATINHIIETIHLLRSQFNNKINYLIGGDINQLKIDRILDSYGALRQIITTATRKSAILDCIITDLHTLYQTPRCLPPLQVDRDKEGSDSDHNIILLLPITMEHISRHEKRTIFTRPLPDSAINQFSQFISTHSWEEVIGEKDVNKKVRNFHNTLRTKLDEYFPERKVMVSYLDKKWMTPQLKNLNRKVKREFYKNRKSNKWKKLKRKFKYLKRKRVQDFYTEFVKELKISNPAKWYSMAKRLGAEPYPKNGEQKVECLVGLNDYQASEKIAQHFSKVSQEYFPLDTSKLPAYLPAPEILQVDEETVAKRLFKLKNRKSTQPIDLPSKLRKLFPWELAKPLTDIFNTCLANYQFPDTWKHEWVVPAEKVSNPESLKDLRKISLTSEYSLVFEGLIKDWIMEDIGSKIDKSQYGNKKGISTEHMMVNLMDKILKLLDNNNNRSAVIASMVDWASAFDRQDPTLAIEKFLAMGVRPALVPILVSYLSDRQMQVRVNNTYSSTHKLPGGGPQGTLLGLIEYFVQSNDNANCVDPDLRFKFVDDLTVLELVMMTGLLTEYNFKAHVASDIGIDEQYIPASSLATQENLNCIAQWTVDNKMKINETKSNYMVFSRSGTEMATRLTLNGQTIDRIEETKLVGVWVTTWLDWQKNTREICKRAYARMTMLTKLKYVGVPTPDLLDIYILYIRSLLEYCSVVWHSTLTLEQSQEIENVQKICLKVIMGEEYSNYERGLIHCNLEKLSKRREDRCLKFGLRTLLNPTYSDMFPVNPHILSPTHDTRNREHFKVNKANSESYSKSTIPYIQRMLNEYVKSQQKYPKAN